MNQWKAAQRSRRAAGHGRLGWAPGGLVRTVLAPIALAMAAVLLLGACAAETPQPVVQQDFIMDTSIVLTINADDTATGEKAAGAIFDRLRTIDAHVRVQDSASEAFAVNAAAGKGAVAVSPDTFAIATTALELAKLSNGAFDPTIGPISLLWNIESDDPHVPTPAELRVALPLVDWHDVHLDAAKRTIGLARQGMRLDFGGVAKGYAALEAARICREAGITSALLNMGDSSIFALGSKAAGRKWRIGIQNPSASGFGGEGVDRGKMLGVVEVSDQVVISSGTYERFFVRDGQKYHHIMDPKTGFPVQNGLVQVTLIVPGDTHIADGLSTAVLVLGPEQGLALVESLPGVAAILVFGDKRVLLSSRAKGIFSLDDPGYTLVGAATDAAATGGTGK